MILIVKYEGRIWAGVYMLRDETIRLISVRRTRKKETDLYGKNAFFVIDSWVAAKWTQATTNRLKNAF
jgi:hypothetical protein